MPSHRRWCRPEWGRRIPQWVSQLPYRGVVYRPLPELPQVVELAIAWPAHNPSPFIREFVNIARQVTAGSSPADVGGDPDESR